MINSCPFGSGRASPKWPVEANVNCLPAARGGSIPVALVRSRCRSSQVAFARTTNLPRAARARYRPLSCARQLVIVAGIRMVPEFDTPGVFGKLADGSI